MTITAKYPISETMALWRAGLLSDANAERDVLAGTGTDEEWTEAQYAILLATNPTWWCDKVTP